MATTYATVEAVEAFIAAGDFRLAELPGTVEEKETCITEAEADIDRLFAFGLTRDATTGRKLNPADLTAAQVDALERATCVQVAWRLEVGDESIIGVDDEPGAAPQPRPPSPAAIEALSGYGFKWRSGTVAPAPEPSEAE